MLPDMALMVLGSFAPMFTRPVWEHVQVLVTGAILCRGPHTVAGVLRTLGLADDETFCKYHRVLSRARWSGLQGFLVETLRTRQQRIASLEQQLGRVQSIIASARRLKGGESLDGIFGLLHEEDRRLAAGEEPLDVIAWALSDEGARGWFGGNGTDPDPLEEYRL